MTITEATEIVLNAATAQANGHAYCERILAAVRRSKDALAPNVPRPVPSRVVACLDCGKPYSEFPLDMVFSREDWLEINPAGNGLLCANCMCIRAAALPGVVTVQARLGKPK